MTDYVLNPEVEKKNKQRSAIITAAIMAAIFVLMFLIILHKPEEDFPQEGIMVAFGSTDVGSGELTPSYSEPVESASSQEIAEEVREVVPNDDVNTVAVVEKENKKRNETPNVQKQDNPQVTENQKKVEEPKINQNQLFTKNNNNNSSNSKGDNVDLGDAGDPRGGEDGASKGNPSGLGKSGSGWSLSGRGKVFLDEPGRVYEEGKLVIKIGVDKNGNVVSAEYVITQSKVTDPNMIKMAKDAALNSKFTSNTSAPDIQYGYITYDFRFK